MERREVFKALETWGIRPEKVRRVRGVFKVWTDREIYCLKPVKDSKKRLLFFDSVIRYVKSRGFQVLASYIHTPEGEPFGNYDGQNLILTPWIEGKEIRYRSIKEMIGAAKVLAEFHKAAEGYKPEPGIKVKDKLGKWPEKLARRVGDIEFYIELAEKEGSDFDWYFLKNADRILKDTKEAFIALRDSVYYKKVEESRNLTQICHGDPARRNFLIDKKGQIHLIDYDSMKLDLPITDLWRLLRRTLNRDQWDIDVIRRILDGYTEVRPLDQEDYQLLAIFLTFPEKVWRILRKYYEKRGRDGWSYKRLFRKLRKFLAQQENRARFLSEFKMIYCEE
ncbi:hypothetical protein BBF96_10455 [Anoxybacter fermentans]|uniref:Aminoglycoside phosphotransferase domain-containing protein n=1 Tax=Anoxybacter fermentans TaxID=1323375 RepID=A0A3S9SZR4_9FIRM|nr:CotS family spore coat protein [Anoxybacter fermentans]AZR73769.1 hypothetical protein BBF96_10455 [Anoxybacter fermentans]